MEEGRPLSVTPDTQTKRKYIFPDSENLNLYLWQATQERRLSNNEVVLLLMPCRSHLWQDLFETLIFRLSLPDIKQGLLRGMFRIMVPMDVINDISKVDPILATQISPCPSDGTYNLVILDDNFCSVHQIAPQSPDKH